MDRLLFIDSCMDRERSRTYRMAKAAVSALGDRGYEVTELVLENEPLRPMDTEVLRKRNTLLRERMYDDPMFAYAKQFRDADRVVIAAPYWDHGFPSILKIYLESVSCPGITYRYTEEGVVGLCRAGKLTYITTRGGFTTDDADLGYATIRELCGDFGIRDVDCISANGFDIPSTDVEGIVSYIERHVGDMI